MKYTYDNSDAIIALRPGKSFVWSEEGNKVEWVDSDVTTPTDSEIAAKLKELNDAEPMRMLRAERNRLLAETDWWASSDLTLSDEQKKYRQDLRDITKSATSLDDVKWPTKPE